MSGPFSDDDLRRRVAELGRRESASAPALSRLRPRGARPGAGRLRPAMALGAVLMAMAALSWWPRATTHRPMASHAAATPSPWGAGGSWELPTDELLSDVGAIAPAAEAARLAREIEGLLEP